MNRLGKDLPLRRAAVPVVAGIYDVRMRRLRPEWSFAKEKNAILLAYF